MNRAWLLLVVLLALPGAQAAEANGLELLPSNDVRQVFPSEETVLTYEVTGYTINDSYLLIANLEVPDTTNWNFRVVPEEVIINPGDTREFEIHVSTPRLASPREVDLQFTITAVQDTQSLRLVESTTMEWVPANLVLGRWANPLSEPLDGQWGTFGLNILAWIGVGLAAVLFLNPFVKLAAMRTKTDLDDKIVKIITWPIFILIAVFGFKQSLESFELPGWAILVLDRLWGAVLTVSITYIIYRLWSEVVIHLGRRFTEKSESELDDRLYPVFEKAGGILIILAGLFYFVDSLGVNMTYFAAGGAAASLVIAFAAQDTLSNFFSGVHLLIDQPFKEGDDIMLESGEVCRVERIGLRSTRLYHRANHEYFVMPNNILANARITNMLFPDQHYKMNILVGVAYGSDVDLVTKLMMECAEEHPLVMSDEGHKPWVWFMNFGDSALDFKLYVWVEDLYARWAVANDLRRAMDAKFRANNIEIPFPQRVIWQGQENEPAVIDESGGPEHKTLRQATKNLGED